MTFTLDLTLQRRVFDNKVGLNIQTNGKWPNICFIYLYVCTFQTIGFYQKGKILTTISHNRTYYLLAHHLHSIRYNDNETETRSRWKLNKRDKNNNAQWATWMPYTPQIGVNKRYVHIALTESISYSMFFNFLFWCVQWNFWPICTIIRHFFDYYSFKY